MIYSFVENTATAVKAKVHIENLVNEMQDILESSEKPTKKFRNNINMQPGENADTNFIKVIEN